jgi:hypothetical protein
MRLIQARLVTDQVAVLARHYSCLLGLPEPPVNDYYVELPAGPATLAFSRCRFTEDQGPACQPAGHANPVRTGEVILDFLAEDVDAEHARLRGMGAAWLFGPTTQPWGARTMMLRDQEGHLINIISRHPTRGQD